MQRRHVGRSERHVGRWADRHRRLGAMDAPTRASYGLDVQMRRRVRFLHGRWRGLVQDRSDGHDCSSTDWDKLGNCGRGSEIAMDIHDSDEVGAGELFD